MEEDILSGIIEVEKEIQKRLEIEKNKSQEWLEKVKRDAEKEVLTEKTRLKESFNKTEKDAKFNAGKKASETLKNARAESEKLEGLREETLKGIILKHITRILP